MPPLSGRIVINRLRQRINGLRERGTGFLMLRQRLLDQVGGGYADVAVRNRLIGGTACLGVRELSTRAENLLQFREEQRLILIE